MPKYHQSAGFTLIEVVIATTVLSVIILVVFQTLVGIGKINLQTKNLTLATQIAQRQIELYRNTSYGAIPIGTTDLASSLTPYPSLRTPRSANVVVAEVTPSVLKRVDVSVSYTQSGVTKQVKLTTLIATRGINR